MRTVEEMKETTGYRLDVINLEFFFFFVSSKARPSTGSSPVPMNWRGSRSVIYMDCWVIFVLLKHFVSQTHTLFSKFPPTILKLLMNHV
jgi:hypothetical protein